MTDRIAKLKQMQQDAKPSLSIERARLATEAYEKYAVETPVLQRAHALSHILRNMTIYIQEGELIVGNHNDKPRCAPVFPEYFSEWIIDEIDDFQTRPSDPLEISDEEKKELVEILEKWRGRSFDKAVERVLSEEAKEAESAGIMTIGNRDCGTGHLTPDYWTALEHGLGYQRQRCLDKIAETTVDSVEKMRQVDFWNAVIITIDAAEAYAHRYSELAAKQAAEESDPVRKAELLEISDICSRIPIEAPKTFAEAIQMVWFIHVIISIEANGHGTSLHRFDQYMNPFYVKDLKEGRIT